MPLIEYECTACHKRVEKIQSFSATPMSVCPHCGGAMEQCISAPAVQFKGSGWYVTDYAKSGAAKPATGSKDAAAADTASPAEKSSGDSASSAAKSEPASAPAAAATAKPE